MVLWRLFERSPEGRSKVVILLTDEQFYQSSSGSLEREKIYADIAAMERTFSISLIKGEHLWPKA